MTISCSCGSAVLKSYIDGKVKLRSRIILFEGDKTLAKCLTCGKEVQIPVLLKKSISKSVSAKGKLTHYIVEKSN